VKTQYELINFMKDNGFFELPEPVWVTDFYMNCTQGNVIRDIKPTLAIPCLNKYFSDLKFFRIGKKGQKLKAFITAESASNGWGQMSYLSFFDTEEEAKKFYLEKKEKYINMYENNINDHKQSLKSLKSDLKKDKKDL